jgi:hypothetical protein
MSTKLRDDFVSMFRVHFAKHPDTHVPIPPKGCQLRRINADGSITYVSDQVTSEVGGRMCNVWRDYYDQYGRKRTIPEPEGDV